MTALGPVLRPVLVDEPIKRPGANLQAGPTLPTFDRIVAGEVGLLTFIHDRSKSVIEQLAGPR